MNAPFISFYKSKNILLVFYGISICSLCMGQNQLIGDWTNSYGSALSITSQSQGILQGEYKSSTGSAGKYAVIGTYTPPTDQNGDVAVALTISWNSLDGSTKDPSQFWTSVMVGTYYSETGSMEIINQIAAAEKFDVVNVQEPGIYPESLTFTKKPHEPALTEAPPNRNSDIITKPKSTGNNFSPLLKSTSQNDIAGLWVNSDPTSPYRSIRIALPKKDTVQARIMWNQDAIQTVGLTVAPSNDLQSLSMASSSLPQTNSLLGLAGLLDIANNRLKLVISRARGVAVKNKYASTDINVFYFSKQSP